MTPNIHCGDGVCYLGYGIHSYPQGFFITTKPCQECPKPRTWKALYIQEHGGK